MRLKFFLIILCCAFLSHGQDIMRFKVVPKGSDYLDCPVGIPLQGTNYNQDQGMLSLFEIRENEELPVPCQLEPGHTATLWFILSGKTEEGGTRQFIVKRTEDDRHPARMHIAKSQGKLNIEKAGTPVLAYQYETVMPPEGVSPLFQRSGFIHPLWSPDGQILSRIQPPDHYHHYGIWGPWTKTHINGREVDFWNLAKGQGTVRFGGFLSEVAGPVFAGFKALQEHIDFGSRGPDQIAMNEVLDVRSWNLSEGKAWLIDYTTTLNTPLDSGILLDAYRYGGGIGFRAVEQWHKDNSTVLTSEMKDRLNADGSKARWCIIEGASVSEKGRSGILFMGHPSNREFPEPMRVWPVDANRGRGDVYFEFCPIRHEDWILKKGRDYSLKYRLLVFDGDISPETAEMYWYGFAHPPGVEIQTLHIP